MFDTKCKLSKRLNKSHTLDISYCASKLQKLQLNFYYQLDRFKTFKSNKFVAKINENLYTNHIGKNPPTYLQFFHEFIDSNNIMTMAL